MTQEQITFYSMAFSPYAHRVQLALDEAKAQYTYVAVDLRNKPEWFTSKINKSGEVPVLTYGGPDRAPHDPSTKTARVTESLIILEFLADIFPESHLLPKDPVGRARARLFVATVQSVLVDAFNRVFYKGASTSELVEACRRIQDLLPETGFAVGEWSIADAAAGPFVVRSWQLLEHELGKYPLGEGKMALGVLRGPDFARFLRYTQDLKSRESFRTKWDEAVQLEGWSHYPPIQRV